MFKKLFKQYKNIFHDKKNLYSLAAGLLFFTVSLFIQKMADSYVISIKGVAVSDFFLDHLPALDIDSLIIQFALLLTAVTLFLAITKPKFINFSLKTIALFIIIRAFLISVTHLGANTHQIVFDPTSFGYRIYNDLYNTSNDFFFSAHTGAPFLGALILWPEKRWRYFYIFASVISGLSVLIGHMHYSIDVFAAPMIAHSIFMMARYLFSKDYQLSRSY
jgi:hypothetical protein